MKGARSRLSPVLVVSALALVAAVSWVGRAHAATVVIVRPAAPSAELTETASRLHGELLSLGLAVVIADPASVPAPGAADAVLEIIGDATPEAVEISVFDRRAGRTERARVAADGSAGTPAAGRLAIRAVEVLRSKLVELDLLASEPRAPAPARSGPEAASVEPPATVHEAARVGLEAGAAVVTSLDGVGAAILPMARVGWAPRSWFVLQATLAGFGSSPTITTTAGSARVGQQYGVVGGAGCAPVARSLGLCLALAAGALHIGIDGRADTPAHAHFVERWSLLLDVGAGARLHLPGRYYLTLATHVQMAAPYVAIHFVDTLVATTGRPNLLVSVTVGAWL